ncbi:MAG: hypothetical protein Q8T08_11700, partial [Ignavibacteria bacterium]|nr:hypothetical protein [Ignavibacteria bacterium]
KQYQILGKRNDDLSTAIEVKIVENKNEFSSGSYEKPEIESKWIKRNSYCVAEAKLESRHIIECILSNEDSFPADLLPSILQIFLSNGFFKPEMLHSTQSINDQSKVSFLFSVNCSLPNFQVILDGPIRNIYLESDKKVKINYYDMKFRNKNTQTLKGFKVSIDSSSIRIELDTNYNDDNFSSVRVNMLNTTESWIMWDQIRRVIFEYITNNPLIVPNYFLYENDKNNEYISQETSRVPEKYRELISLWHQGKTSNEIAILLGIQPKTVDNKICNLRRTYGEGVVHYRKDKKG